MKRGILEAVLSFRRVKASEENVKKLERQTEALAFKLKRAQADSLVGSPSIAHAAAAEDASTA
ncbi:MAG: hypothetical protein LBU76_08985 [Azoarcus sp.]|jgi:hypothetical protein|nr:hypothetical protein [Azoarcus sp.]